MANYIGSGLDYSTPLTITSRQRTFRSETVNLKTQTNRSDAQRWDLQITLTPSANFDQAPAGAALSVHRTVNGISKSFNIEMPQHVGVHAPLNSVSVREVTPSGSTDVPISTDGLGTIIQAGQYVTFGSFLKVYQVISAVSSFDVGETTEVLEIFPPLIQNIAKDALIDFKPEIAVFYARDGVDGTTYASGILVSAKVSLVEALV